MAHGEGDNYLFTQKPAQTAPRFGRTTRGAPSDPSPTHRPGPRRPKPGDYSDTVAKGNSVHLLATESTGAR